MQYLRLLFPVFVLIRLVCFDLADDGREFGMGRGDGGRNDLALPKFLMIDKLLPGSLILGG